MQLEAKSDLSTGNQCYASYVLRSHDLVFAFSAPSGVEADGPALAATQPHPGVTGAAMRDFCSTHGLAVRAVGESLYSRA